VPDILEESAFDLASFTDELRDAPTNLAVGTSLWFENGRVRIWEVRLDPGARCPFHAHITPYFWTCVSSGVGRQHSGDGVVRVQRYDEGDTRFSELSPEAPMLHDLENVGDSILRFITVELLG